ncbi:MAG: hypothetical protein ACD_21C00258G0002 [uncultured bacterium]|nr:MAG: hypothetical protein ACD_21C00258G0002 [uncultured bacterium]
MLNKKLMISLLCAPLLSGCSVFMAAHKTGVDAEKLGECRTRACIISKGAVPVHTKKDSKGEITEETYQVKKPTGSAARAVMHGGLDVLTCGLWEVIGTPVEGTLDKDKFYTIKVTYQKDGETVKAVQLN